MNYYRVDDLLPAFAITVEDAGLPIDVTNLNVYVRWQRADGTEIAERTAAKVDATNGVCAYEWTEGDLSVPGVYHAIVQLASISAPSARQSLEQPPEMHLEVLPNTFGERDAMLDQMVPVPTAREVALALNLTLADLDSDVLVAAIDRARRLAYVQCHLYLIGGLSTLQSNMLLDLVTQFAAMVVTQAPGVIYGPYQREQMAAYSYDLRKGAEDGLYGIPQIDSLITYFRDLGRLNSKGIWVASPEWWQPVTERLVDPSRLGLLDL